MNLRSRRGSIEPSCCGIQHSDLSQRPGGDVSNKTFKIQLSLASTSFADSTLPIRC